MCESTIIEYSPHRYICQVKSLYWGIKYLMPIGPISAPIGTEQVGFEPRWPYFYDSARPAQSFNCSSSTRGRLPLPTLQPGPFRRSSGEEPQPCRCRYQPALAALQPRGGGRRHFLPLPASTPTESHSPHFRKNTFAADIKSHSPHFRKHIRRISEKSFAAYQKTHSPHYSNLFTFILPPPHLYTRLR